MAYQALYRKWRPQTFSQVLGQTAVVKTLRRQVETGHVAHAYLFCGCRGTGKTSIAKIMSRAVNCLSPVNGEPCGHCASCEAILTETGMDVLELDAASNNGVDDVRGILEEVCYPPQFGKYRVYIIDEVHMLSNAAFNALLKTLEEPPAHVVFILATTEPQKIPATILSRVQRYDFGRISSDLMIGRMKEALADLGLTADESALHMVARAAEGAMRDAFSILDMCVAAAEDNHISEAKAREILGTSDKDFLFAFYELIANRDTSGVMLQIDTLMRSGREAGVFLHELQDHTRSLLTVKAIRENAAAVLDVTQEDEERYRIQSRLFSQERLLRILDLLIHAEGDLRYASTPRIGLESTLLHACEENVQEDSTAILERVNELQVQNDIISELRAKLDSLEEKVSKGTFIAAKSSGKNAEKPIAETKPREPEAPPVPKEEKEVWAQFQKKVSKDTPPLYMLLHYGKFIGVQNDVYRIQVMEKAKSLAYVKLREPKLTDQFSQILSEIAGKTVRFEAVLEGESEIKVPVRTDSEKKLFDAFGRESVIVDEEKSSEEIL